MGQIRITLSYKGWAAKGRARWHCRIAIGKETVRTLPSFSLFQSASKLKQIIYRKFMQEWPSS